MLTVLSKEIEVCKVETKNQLMAFKEVILEIFHIKTVPDMIMTFIASIFGAIFGYFNLIVVQNENAFQAMLFVLFLDWVAGMTLAFKNGNFQTRKAIKIVYYVCGYGLVLATVLSIEKGFEYAQWMTEAVMLPIITFTVIGSLKKLSILGILPKGVFLKITENIDNYKDNISGGGQAEIPQQDQEAA